MSLGPLAGPGSMADMLKISFLPHTTPFLGRSHGCLPWCWGQLGTQRMGKPYSGGSVKRELRQGDENGVVKSPGHVPPLTTALSLPSRPLAHLSHPDLMVNVGSISFSVCKGKERACCQMSLRTCPLPCLCPSPHLCALMGSPDFASRPPGA